ncbi:amidohydrolase [Flocculibacter collagenilyticus]|uniref:amidohydrolase n=1 Tax=Flocculibacter collagenilyticus TaxID=2744479 RepID=UPI001F206F97|nr:amidohydrolase [Flocculibacter collagenilyticus]
MNISPQSAFLATVTRIKHPTITVITFISLLLSLCAAFSSYAHGNAHQHSKHKNVMPADESTSLLVHNINGYTFTTDRKLQRFSSMLIRHGKIHEIGDNLLKKYQDQKITRLNGQGRTVLPGMTDAHGHILGLGFNRMNVDVRGLTSAQATAKKVADYANQNPQQQWIKGRGWNQVLWPSKQFPTANDLDEVIADRPVMLTRVDGHASWLNTKALQLAGINSSTISPEGGEIIKDENGQPTGILIDNAMNLVEKKLPKPTNKEKQMALDIASKHLLALGVTSVHDAGIDHNTYHLYKDKAANNTLDMRIYAMISANDPHFETMLEKGHVKDEADFLSIRSVKIYGDGALGSRGAALLKPYQDQPDNHGLLVTSQTQLRQLMQQTLAHNFQINLHAIGDRANRIALDEFSFAFKQNPANQALRHRVEHAQVISVDDIPRFKALNIIPSMQPTHATSDMNMAGDRVGKQRLAGAYAWQTLLKQNSVIALGSDFPIELANPFFGIHAAVTRQNRDNQPVNGWIPEEAMTVAQAVRGFTIDAAYAAHQEHSLGGLETGKWADFIMVDRDIFTIPTNELWKTQVLETWVAGKRIQNTQ